MYLIKQASDRGPLAFSLEAGGKRKIKYTYIYIHMQYTILSILKIQFKTFQFGV